MALLKYLVPKIRRTDLIPLISVTIVCGLIAGLYGIAHDQITYSISPEYFTKLKFHQFDYADFGFGDRIFVSIIGFFATWCVGAIAGWFLARRLIPNQPRQVAVQQIRKGIICVLAFGMSFGLLAYGYGLWRGPEADYSAWEWAAVELKVTQLWPFVRVAYIHNAGYLGGLVGLIVALIAMRPRDEEQRS